MDFRKSVIGKVFLLVFAALTLLRPDAGAQQRVAVRNNLLYDLSVTPNIGFDYARSRHLSYGVTLGFRPWPRSDEESRKWRHLLVAPGLRYWTDSVFHKGFIGVDLVWSHYNVADVKFPFGLYPDVRHQRLQGDLAMLGLSYGYTWRLNRSFRLEAEAGLGLGYTKGDRFDCGKCGTRLDDYGKFAAVPKLALNIVYNRVPKAVAAPAEPEAPAEVLPEPQPTPPQLTFSQVLPLTVSDQLMADNPVLAEYKDYRPYDNTRILRKERGALYVHFPLDKSTLLHDFRDNAETLDRILSITRQIMADSMSNVRLIQIIGLASVEGPVAHNQTLSDDRAQALKSYVQQQIPEAADSLFETIGGGEAWTELRDQLNDILTGADATSPTTLSKSTIEQAIAIIDDEQNLDRREQRLRQLAGGRLYQFLRNDVLPYQRNSGYLRIYFERVPDSRAATINSASELLSQERYYEALALLDGVKDDPRSWNALGVALYMTGRQGEARQYFARAAATGNADAQRNLDEINQR